MPYEDALSITKGDEFTSISELSQIETLLVTLESKLEAFKKNSPKLDSRRGLLNIGLKTLLGTAVISCVTLLRDAFDELQSDQKDVHSITNQVTYIKKLDSVVNVNVYAISNLSIIIKSNITDSHRNFQQTIRDVMWLSLTIHGQSTLPQFDN
jgi:hypothetical protein